MLILKDAVMTYKKKPLTIVCLYTPEIPNNGRVYLQIWAIVFGDIGAVTLAEHRDLLLNVLNLIFRLLQVDDLDGHHLFGAIVDALVDLTKRPLPNAFLLCEILLRVKPGILCERDSRVVIWDSMKGVEENQWAFTMDHCRLHYIL